MNPESHRSITENGPTTYGDFQQWIETITTELSAISERVSDMEKAAIQSFLIMAEHEIAANIPTLIAEEDEKDISERLVATKEGFLTDCLEMLQKITTVDVSEYKAALAKQLQEIEQ